MAQNAAVYRNMPSNTCLPSTPNVFKTRQDVMNNIHAQEDGGGLAMSYERMLTVYPKHHPLEKRKRGRAQNVEEDSRNRTGTTTFELKSTIRQQTG